jgi:hypothetical protein
MAVKYRALTHQQADAFAEAGCSLVLMLFIVPDFRLLLLAA